MEVYKAFGTENGKLVSFIVKGKAKTTYPVGRMHYGRRWLVTQEYLPTAFRKLKDAIALWRELGWGEDQVWRCETKAIKKPKQFLDICLVEEGRISGDGSGAWPPGTVFCRGIKPIERIDVEDTPGAT